MGSISGSLGYAWFYTLLNLYGVLFILGVPGECWNTEATVSLRLKRQGEDKAVREWRGAVQKNRCAGLYYNGGKNLYEKPLFMVVGDLMQQMIRDAGAVVTQLGKMPARVAPVTPQKVVVPPPPEEFEPPIVAVFDIEDPAQQFQVMILEQLAEYLAVKLTETGSYRVVPRSQLRERLNAEKKEGHNACYDESCQIELGKAVAAEMTLSTRLIKVGTSCAITASLYDLRTETAVKAKSVRTDCSDNALMDGIDKLAEELGDRGK